MLEYIYAAMFVVIGLMLLFLAAKENRAFYVAGGYFLLLGAWWYCNIRTQANLFQGTWGWVFKGITASVLLFCCYIYYLERKKGNGDK